MKFIIICQHNDSYNIYNDNLLQYHYREFDFFEINPAGQSGSAV
jgi:hypothetical protein